MKILKEIYTSLKQQPVWTIYSLCLAPIYYFPALLACVTKSMINLDTQSGLDLWDDMT